MRTCCITCNLAEGKKEVNNFPSPFQCTFYGAHFCVCLLCMRIFPLFLRLTFRGQPNSNLSSKPPPKLRPPEMRFPSGFWGKHKKKDPPEPLKMPWKWVILFTFLECLPFCMRSNWHFWDNFFHRRNIAPFWTYFDPPPGRLFLAKSRKYHPPKTRPLFGFFSSNGEKM